MYWFFAQKFASCLSRSACAWSRLTRPLAACLFRRAAFAAAPVRGCGFLVRAYAHSASALGTSCTADHNLVHGGRAARSGK